MSSIDTPPNGDVPAVVCGYAAVPLDLRARRLETYRAESLDRIRNSLALAAREAMRNEWVRSEDLARRLVGIIDRSLVESHEKRIFLNRRYDTGALHEVVDMKDERIVRAMNGEASPYDLLDSLVDYPELGSLEIAKLSHPLDFMATEAMDLDVATTLSKFGASIMERTPLYKPRSYHDDLPAMTVLRKQSVGAFEVPAGEIEVVRRQSFLVRGDEEAREIDPLLDRKIRNRDRFGEIAQKIEGYLPHVGLHRYLSGISSIATSYFAWVRKKPHS